MLGVLWFCNISKSAFSWALENGNKDDLLTKIVIDFSAVCRILRLQHLSFCLKISFHCFLFFSWAEVYPFLRIYLHLAKLLEMTLIRLSSSYSSYLTTRLTTCSFACTCAYKMCNTSLAWIIFKSTVSFVVVFIARRRQYTRCWADLTAWSLSPFWSIGLFVFFPNPHFSNKSFCFLSLKSLQCLAGLYSTCCKKHL